MAAESAESTGAASPTTLTSAAVVGRRARVACRTISMAAMLGAAGCAIGVGYNVVPAQESQVKAGMTPEQVLGILGRPTLNIKYRNQVGPTYTYRVLGPMPPMLFDVDFDADGKVMATSERMDLDRGGRGHGGGGGGFK